MILNHNSREFFKDSRHPDPGALTVGCEPQFVLHLRGIRGSAGSGAVSQNRVLEDPYRSCAFGSFENVKQRLKLLYYHSKSMKIDENHCTVVFFHQTSMNIIVL